MIKVSTVKEAWSIVDKIFPTDYIKDEARTNGAGYDIYKSTAEGGHYDYICDLGDRLEVNLKTGEVINIWIVPEQKQEKAQIKGEIDDFKMQVLNEKVAISNIIIANSNGNITDLEMAEHLMKSAAALILYENKRAGLELKLTAIS